MPEYNEDIEPIVIEPPKEKADATFIFLHGLGDEGSSKCNECSLDVLPLLISVVIPLEATETLRSSFTGPEDSPPPASSFRRHRTSGM